VKEEIKASQEPAQAC